MSRIYLSLSDDKKDRLDKACKKAGMTRSHYIEYLLSGRTDIRPPVMRFKQMVKEFDEIDKELKVIAIKDSLSDDEKILVMTRLSDLKEMFSKVVYKEDKDGDRR